MVPDGAIRGAADSTPEGPQSGHSRAGACCAGGHRKGQGQQEGRGAGTAAGHHYPTSTVTSRVTPTPSCASTRMT